MAKTDIAEKTFEAVCREKEGRGGELQISSCLVSLLLSSCRDRRRTKFPFCTMAKQAKVTTMTRRGSYGTEEEKGSVNLVASHRCRGEREETHSVVGNAHSERQELPLPVELQLLGPKLLNRGLDVLEDGEERKGSVSVFVEGEERSESCLPPRFRTSW